MSTATLSTAEWLQTELSDPVAKQAAADLLGISPGSVYDSMRKYDALFIQWANCTPDEQHRIETMMRRHIPCIHRGGVEQPNGTFKGGRYIIPRDMFIRWYTSAGLDGELLERLYGGDAA